MEVTPELLSFFPLLKALPPEALVRLAEQSSLQKFARRAVVLNAGTREGHVCFLFEGRLQGVDFTVDGREVGLYFVEPGDFCGELCLFGDGTQPEYVIVLSPAVIVCVPIAALRGVMMSAPEMVTTLGERLARRLRQMTQQRSLLGMPNIAQRVCCQLWMLLTEADKTRGTVTEIRNPPTHMEIAIMLNLSRETVTRVFQVLQTQGVVKRDGAARLSVLDPSALKLLAEGGREL
jgi:CRP-like cAMP-binding protein